MESFFSLLSKRVDDASSLICVGLDPHISDLKSPSADAALSFCAELVRATSRYAAAYKPNAAFFEQFGAQGWSALKEVIRIIHEESDRLGSRILTIYDAKRGDISSTAEAYAKACFEELNADSLTLNPYLGRDSLTPFISVPEKGIFLLCKTSNPGSSDLQDLLLEGGELVYEHVARLALEWNSADNIGLVVGATHPQAMARVRAVNPTAWLLAPGLGAQGGELEACLQAGLRSDNKGVLFPISRGISRAADKTRAAAEYRDSIIYEINRRAKHG